MTARSYATSFWITKPARRASGACSTCMLRTVATASAVACCAKSWPMKSTVATAARPSASRPPIPRRRCQRRDRAMGARFFSIVSASFVTQAPRMRHKLRRGQMSPIMPSHPPTGCAGHRTRPNSVELLAFIVTCVGLLTPVLSVAEAPRSTLLSNVRIIELPAGTISAARDVLVSDGRIATVARHGTLRVRDATFIDGRGGYLMPGLTEGHAHVPGPKQKQYAEDVLLLYVAHG